jgi:hypothetical protein
LVGRAIRAPPPLLLAPPLDGAGAGLGMAVPTLGGTLPEEDDEVSIEAPSMVWK